MFARFLLALAMSALFASPVTAETLKVVNWNVKIGSVEEIAKRKSGISAVPEGKAPDVLILQENQLICSCSADSEVHGYEQFTYCCERLRR